MSGQPNVTKFAHKTWFYVRMNLSENVFQNLPVRVFFRKGNFLGDRLQRLRISCRDFSEMIKKSRKFMTRWPAYGMLAFHLYHWNQLKVITVVCTARTRNDIPGHRRTLALPSLALQM